MKLKKWKEVFKDELVNDKKNKNIYLKNGKKLYDKDLFGRYLGQVGDKIIIKARKGVILIEKLEQQHKTELDTIESEPLFTEFINALSVDAMKHPEKLHTIKEVWDKEWNELFKKVTAKRKEKKDIKRKINNK